MVFSHKVGLSVCLLYTFEVSRSVACVVGVVLARGENEKESHLISRRPPGYCLLARVQFSLGVRQWLRQPHRRNGIHGQSVVGTTLGDLDVCWKVHGLRLLCHLRLCTFVQALDSDTPEPRHGSYSMLLDARLVGISTWHSTLPPYHGRHHLHCPPNTNPDLRPVDSDIFGHQNQKILFGHLDGTKETGRFVLEGAACRIDDMLGICGQLDDTVDGTRY